MKKLPMFKLVINTVRHSWKAHPPVFCALIFSSMFLVAVQVTEIYAMRFFFDTAADYAGGAVSFDDLAISALPAIAVLLFEPVAKIGEYLAQGYFWRMGVNYLQSLFHLRVGKMPLCDFEIPGTFDNMQKAYLGSDEAPSVSRSIIEFLFYNLPFFVFTSVFLVSVKPLLVFAMMFVFFSVLISQIIRARIIFKFENETAGLKRQTHYFESCVTEKEYFKETRTLGVFGYFYKNFLDLTALLNKKSMRAERKIAYVETLLRLFNILGYAGIIGMLLYYVFDGSVSVGAFAAVFYSVGKINNLLQDMVSNIGGAIPELATTSFLLNFLEEPKQDKSTGPLDKSADIHVKDVSFRYPGSGRDVVSHINLTIKRGESLAIVGENGAGKTTLTKLITGLYQPSEGAVFCGGKDINLYAPTQRYDSVSGVFQDFIKYKLTAGENITISDTGSGLPADEALDLAEAPRAKFTNGLDTMLSREFDGTELSGGEWQRVAIARGFYRRHELIILDEPTSAIDPIEESNIFRLFKESARGKTAVLVTHRLGSAKIADRIIVMENGRITESGAHADLMEKQGKYFSMFTEQAKWYKR
jgi:ATP-binding cassette subfamily B protein